MKTFIVVTAIGAMCIAPYKALSPSNYHTHTRASYEAMKEFCSQAHEDSISLGKPETGKLLALCGG